jgi:hypothetical protein
MHSKFIALIVFLLFVVNTVSAVAVDTSNHYQVEVSSVQLRSEQDYYWSNSIQARDKEAIDIRAELFLGYNNYYGYSSKPFDWIETWAEIYAWDNGWVLIDETNTRTITLNYLNYSTVYWYDAFVVDASYPEYKVIVKAKNYDYYGNASSNFAFVDVIETTTEPYCSDIEILDKGTIYLNENDAETIYFKIRNNSNERFEINYEPIVSEFEGGMYFDVQPYNYDISLASGETGEIALRFTTREVNNNTKGRIKLKIKGNFAGGKYCSYTDIKKEFNLLIEDNPLNACRNIRIYASNETMKENDTEYFSFIIRNDSDNTFHAKYHVFDDSPYFDAREDYFNEIYVPAHSSRKASYKVKSGNVYSDETGTIYIKVSGNYVNGNYCSYSEIGEKRIELTVKKDAFEESRCEDLFLRTKTLNLEENDFTSVSFFIENNSNERFYIDSYNGINVKEYSPVLEFMNFRYPSYIPANSERRVSFDAETGNVNSDKTVTAYLELKGEFEDGKKCYFSDTKKSFNVKINDSMDERCKEIKVITKTVKLRKGETEYFNFTIENNENRRFYIDNLNVYDISAKIEASEYDYPYSIDAKEKETITIKIKAKEEGEAKAYIEVIGHYENGRSCSAREIGKESFNVIIEETTFCSDFYLSAPTKKTLSGKEEIALKIDNPLNREGTIRISGVNLAVSPHTINVPANTSFTKIIEVELLEGKESFLTYKITLEGCTQKTKTTKILSGKKTFDLVEFPSKKSISLKGEISFTIKNNSFSSKEFKVSLQTPPELKANEKIISIPANSTRTTTLEIEAEKSGNYLVLLSIESSGKKIEKEIELTVKEEQVNVSAEITQGILNEKELKITIENNTKEKIEGNLLIELPENWVMEGNTNVSVKAGEKKEFLFKLKTDGTEKEIPVTLNLKDGRKIIASAETKATTGITTALISLGKNTAVAIALIAIIVLIVILLAKREEK